MTNNKKNEYLDLRNEKVKWLIFNKQTSSSPKLWLMVKPQKFSGE